VLSENELIELLDQLKLGALHGVASEADPVGHWPVLIGDGLCLSLQSAARDEFAIQPDKITVVGAITNRTTLSAICAGYWQVHHVSTGLHDRSILIGYDRHSLDIFPLLHDSLQRHDEGDEKAGHSSAAYDFSLAVAASLDPAAHLDGIDHPVAFLPLEFDADTRLAGGWRIVIDAFGKQGEFFIGLLNPMSETRIAASTPPPVEAGIVVEPLTLSRMARSNTLTVTLSQPHQVTRFLPAQVQTFSLEQQGAEWVVRAASTAKAPADAPALDLMVQQSLQLAADDLYLLLVEAMGTGSALRLRFDPAMDIPEEWHLVSGKALTCLSINDLPVKNAELVFSGNSLELIVKE
jgi:hypothetical protein